MGFEIFYSGIILGRKIWEVCYLYSMWLDLSRDFLGILNKLMVVPVYPSRVVSANKV